MEHQTRQLLRLLADDLIDRLVGELAKGPMLETVLQGSIPGSRQTVARRLRELETWGIALSEGCLTPGKGRPTRLWWLVGDEISHFLGSADDFLLDLMERRADRHRDAIRNGTADKEHVTRLRGL